MIALLLDSLLRFQHVHRHNLVLNRNRHALERQPLARPQHAFAGCDLEAGTVGGAQDLLAVAAQEAVGQEVERRALVRATVDISKDLGPAAHDEKLSALGALAEGEALGARIAELVEEAED